MAQLKWRIKRCYTFLFASMLNSLSGPYLIITQHLEFNVFFVCLGKDEFIELLSRTECHASRKSLYFQFDDITKCVAPIEWSSNCGSKQTVLKYIFTPVTTYFYQISKGNLWCFDGKADLFPTLLHGLRGILDCDWENRERHNSKILTFLFARNFWINSSGVMFSAKDKKVI